MGTMGSPTFQAIPRRISGNLGEIHIPTPAQSDPQPRASLTGNIATRSRDFVISKLSSVPGNLAPMAIVHATKLARASDVVSPKHQKPATLRTPSAIVEKTRESYAREKHHSQNEVVSSEKPNHDCCECCERHQDERRSPWWDSRQWPFLCHHACCR
jgi:hypothetical protein